MPLSGATEGRSIILVENPAEPSSIRHDVALLNPQHLCCLKFRKKHLPRLPPLAFRAAAGARLFAVAIKTRSLAPLRSMAFAIDAALDAAAPFSLWLWRARMLSSKSPSCSTRPGKGSRGGASILSRARICGGHLVPGCNSVFHTAACNSGSRLCDRLDWARVRAKNFKIGYYPRGIGRPAGKPRVHRSISRVSARCARKQYP